MVVGRGVIKRVTCKEKRKKCSSWGGTRKCKTYALPSLPNNLRHMGKSEPKTCQEFFSHFCHSRFLSVIFKYISLSLSHTWSESEASHMLAYSSAIPKLGSEWDVPRQAMCYRVTIFFPYLLDFFVLMPLMTLKIIQ